MNPEMEAILANYADIIYSDGKHMRIISFNAVGDFKLSILDDMMVSSLDQNHVGDVIETRSGEGPAATSTVTDQPKNDLQKTDPNSNSQSFWQRWFSIPMGWFWGS